MNILEKLAQVFGIDTAIKHLNNEPSAEVFAKMAQDSAFAKLTNNRKPKNNADAQYQENLVRNTKLILDWVNVKAAKVASKGGK